MPSYFHRGYFISNLIQVLVVGIQAKCHGGLVGGWVWAREMDYTYSLFFWSKLGRHSAFYDSRKEQSIYREVTYKKIDAKEIYKKKKNTSKTDKKQLRWLFICPLFALVVL